MNPDFYKLLAEYAENNKERPIVTYFTVMGLLFIVTNGGSIFQLYRIYRDGNSLCEVVLRCRL